MAIGNVIHYYFYHNFTTTWFCVKHIFKKAQYGRNYGRKGINTQSKKLRRGEIMVGMGIVILSNKPSMGEIMVESESIHNQLSSGGAKLW